MHYSSETLKNRRFPSFLDIERRFLICFHRKIAEEYLLKKEIWIVDLFQQLKEKFQLFQQTVLNSDVTTAYSLSRWKFWELLPENTFPFYHFWNMTGSLSDYAGKKFGVGNFFQLFSQSLSAGVSELKTVCPFKQFQTPEE